MITKSEIEYLVRNPLQLLVEAGKRDRYTEQDWEKVYNWLLNHRMSIELFGLWYRNQQHHGVHRFRAVGQLFARYAKIGKGWHTVDDGVRIRLERIKSQEIGKEGEGDGGSGV